MLLYASDHLVDAVVVLATRLGVSQMVIGLTVVAIGTSLPELMASAAAAIEGHPQIAVANVIGSNIANIGLILGLPALVFPICCARRTLNREGLQMLAVSILLGACFLFLGGMSRALGVACLLGFAAFLYFAVAGDEVSKQDDKSGALLPSALKIIVSFVFLLASSSFLVDSTISLAQMFGVSEKIIAISLIAFGTSVPELSVSFVAAKRGQGDILVGNVLGSNISNILLVLGLTAVINPFTTSEVVHWLDPLVMILLAVLMLLFLSQKQGINSKKGGFLLAIYLAFIVGNALLEFIS